ncbi:hypothetical protein ACTFIY_001135 [Dictyostelium cf. discoideum]
MYLRLEGESALSDAKADLFNTNSTNGWCLLNYSGAEYGGENFDEIVGNLKDDQIQYGVVRMGGIEEKGTLKTTVRNVSFVGLVQELELCKKVMLNSYFNHAGITVLNKSHFTRENVIDRSNPLSGSHVIE